MKYLLTVTLLAFSLTLIFSAKAFPQQGNFQIGGGLVYGTGALNEASSNELQNDLGIDINAYYNLTEKIRLGAGFNYFFPKEIDDAGQGVSINAKSNISAFYLDGQYILYDTPTFNGYGLIGLTFIDLNQEATASSGGQSADASNSESETSLNVGGGVEFKQDFGNIFLEIRYDFQTILGAGVRFRF
jgi:opacity protein-like surface antigen